MSLQLPLATNYYQFCSKFASCHFAEKLTSGSHKVPLTENRTVGKGVPRLFYWGQDPRSEGQERRLGSWGGAATPAHQLGSLG